MGCDHHTTIEDQRSKATFKFTEAIFPGVEISIELKEIMSSSNSEFQQIQVVRSVFGKTLVTDGKTQSSEMDEYVYREFNRQNCIGTGLCVFVVTA